MMTEEIFDTGRNWKFNKAQCELLSNWCYFPLKGSTAASQQSLLDYSLKCWEKIHSTELVNDLWQRWIILTSDSVTHYLAAWKWHHIYYHGYASVLMALLKFKLFGSTSHPTTLSDLTSLSWLYRFHSYQRLRPFSLQTKVLSPTCMCTDTLFSLIKAVGVLKGSSQPKYVSAH